MLSASVKTQTGTTLEIFPIGPRATPQITAMKT